MGKGFTSLDNFAGLGPRVVAAPVGKNILLLPVCVLAAGLFFAALFVAERVGLHYANVTVWFLIMAMLMTIIVALSCVLMQVIALARSRHDKPLNELRSRWLTRPMLLRLTLSSVVAPLFLTGFVIFKSAETKTIPYDWDRLLTDIDHLIFGVDPWVPLHAALNVSYMPQLLEAVYVGWQLLLPASLAAVAISMSLRNLSVFYSAMFATWIVAGVIVAALMHSAGPIFAYVLDDQLGVRFEPLRASLIAVLDPQSRILGVQQSLALRMPHADVGPGGGVSAMPSVHVAVTAVYVFAAWKHKYWRIAAIAFAGLVWVGSVYFGYHYATDGPVGFAIAGACWCGAVKVIDSLEAKGRSKEIVDTPWGAYAQ